MFLACGMGAFAQAIFHVFTHAFFKALLFLGAGSVIHGMHDEQDAMKMGGLRKHMPLTWIAFLCGSLALAGFPFTSGFFSKDEILWATWSSGNHLLWGLGALTALMTAFYTFRLYALVFHGKPRFDAQVVHPHESPLVMTVPLLVLAVGALFAGLLGLPHVLSHSNWILPWLAPIQAAVPGQNQSHEGEGLFLVISSVIAIVGIAAGFGLYRNGPARAAALQQRLAPAHGLLAAKYFVDEAYELLILTPLRILADLFAWFDRVVVDGLVNGTGNLCLAIGRAANRLNDGSLQTYGLWIAGGAVVLSVLIVYSLV
jgi:NADH-quinone oxidoreductase subunit L